jgi:hypothetical protein
MSLPPVVFLSTIDWNDSWQRHQIFATALAERGHRVFFVENTALRGPRFSDAPRIARRLARLAKPPPPPPLGAKASGRVVVIPPFTLPPTNRLFRWVNAIAALPHLLRRLKAAGLDERPIVFVYSPSATHLRLIDMLRPRKVVYDCASNFRAHPSAPADIERLELDLLERSEMVITDSDFLFEQKRAEHPSVRQIHQGVPKAFFLPDHQAGSYRTACYFGTIHDGLDYGAIRALAEAGVEVSLIGPVKHMPPPLPPSVKLLPSVPPETLAQTIARFDALLLPYNVDAFNQAVVPAKLYECLATTKPVLSSGLPAMHTLKDLVYVANSPGEWVSAFRGLERTESAERRRARRGRAKRYLREDELGRMLDAVQAEGGRPAPRPRPVPVKLPLPGPLVMTATAVLLRAAAAILCAWRPPFPSYYFNDAVRFDRMGWQAAQAMRGLAPWPEFDFSRRGFHLFLGAFYLVVGHRPLAAQLLVCLLGGLSAWLLYRLGRELAGEKAGLISGWIFALCPSAVFYGSQLLKDPIYLPAIWLSLVALLIGGTRWTTAGVIATAAAVVVRPASGLLMVPLWILRALEVFPRRWRLASVAVLCVALASPTPARTAAGRLLAKAAALPAAITSYRHISQHRDDDLGRKVNTALFRGEKIESWPALAKFMPKATVYTALMPLPGFYPIDGNRGRAAAALENAGWLLTLLLAFALVWRQRRRLDRRALMLLAFTAMAAMAGGLLDLDLGASARHKLQYLPLFLPLAAALVARDQSLTR